MTPENQTERRQGHLFSLNHDHKLVKQALEDSLPLNLRQEVIEQVSPLTGTQYETTLDAICAIGKALWYFDTRSFVRKHQEERARFDLLKTVEICSSVFIRDRRRQKGAKTILAKLRKYDDKVSEYCWRSAAKEDAPDFAFPKNPFSRKFFLWE